MGITAFILLGGMFGWANSSHVSLYSLLATSPTELRLFNHISIVLFLRHIPLMQPMIAIGSNVEPNGAPLTC